MEGRAMSGRMERARETDAVGVKTLRGVEGRQSQGSHCVDKITRCS